MNATLLLALAAIAALVYVFRLWRASLSRAELLASQLSSTTAARTAAERRSAELESVVRQLEASIARLSPFSGVADADEEARRLISEAEQAASNLKQRASADLMSANAEAVAIRDRAANEAREVVTAAREKAKHSEDGANAAVQAAQLRASAIVADAEIKAQEVAGDALAAMRDAERWEQTVQAMKNVVEGYGNRYVVPTHALLDDLAEAFGFTEAGQQLKLVREQVRRASASGTAAACDYVEENRRTTAVRFVIDAFNGKAETILAKVKVENVGTLQQELRDAFRLVNHNGRAFRNARITNDYLDLRLEELRLAGVMEALRIEEREQQRLIKEKIREEEKARREIERALRETAKEEEMLRKAMAKAEERLQTATDAQREKYEQQLSELTVKLREAEVRNERAKSMAQLTRRGHVYVISNIGSFGDHVYKIGMTRRLDPVERIRELGDSSVPFEFDVHAMIFAEDAPALEHRLHQHFALGQVNKVNHRKEFFRAEIQHIRSEVEGLGLTAHWTMTAAARQYRESLAIEERIATDPTAREAWLRRQLLLEEQEDPFTTDEGEFTDGAPVAVPAAHALHVVVIGEDSDAIKIEVPAT